MTLAEIERRMTAKRVRHETLRASVDFLAQLGLVTKGSKGAQWTYAPDDSIWKAAAKGRSLL